ncbi:MAG: hybrid sensor histidine kinase/response regulator [Paludibacteraceae bacterium]|nr:hybrid sensor histidine kinase/response regulator [Paludibacteraceae bacterium]
MILSRIKKARILIIDDQESNVEVLLNFFEMVNYQNVKSITDSREAIEVIQSFKPDIILLDLNMPFVSGFDILEKLKEVVEPDEYLPVLILTADITIEAKRKALNMGAGDFITKPFDLTELQARLNTHLQIRFKNEQIKSYAEEQKQLLATKDKFFSIIAHDVRNPFVGIVNFSKITLSHFDRLDKTEIHESLQLINKTATQGHELLENLLKWSRSQTGTIVISPEKLIVNDIIKSIITSLKSQADNKKIKLLSQFDSVIVLDTDKEMLETILRNLISNAVKFTPENGFVKTSAVLNSDNVIITVTDTGIGISNDDIKKLFRIDSKMQSRMGTANESGSGLGLILCKEFVDKLGGTISVLSKINEGTKFILTFPTHRNKA